MIQSILLALSTSQATDFSLYLFCLFWPWVRTAEKSILPFKPHVLNANNIKDRNDVLIELIALPKDLKRNSYVQCSWKTKFSVQQWACIMQTFLYAYNFCCSLRKKPLVRQCSILFRNTLNFNLRENFWKCSQCIWLVADVFLKCAWPYILHPCLYNLVLCIT